MAPDAIVPFSLARVGDRVEVTRSWLGRERAKIRGAVSSVTPGRRLSGDWLLIECDDGRTERVYRQAKK